MIRALGLLLILAAFVVAERLPAEFRLKKDEQATMRGWILEYDEDGFLFQKFGRGGRQRISWSDLLSEDARRLRLDFKLELTEDEKQGLIEGSEIVFRGGGSARGILVGVDEDGTHRLRVEGVVLPYPKARIREVLSVKIKESEAYTPDEIYVRRLQRRPPKSAAEHQRLGDYLYDVGSFEGAREQYLNAIAKDRTLEKPLQDRLARIRDFMEDKAAAGTFQLAKKLANLDGKYKEAIDLVEKYIEENPGAKRRGIRLADEIQERWVERKRAQFHRVKNEELDRTIREFLVKKPDFDEARSWATSHLPNEIKRRTASRLDLSEDELNDFAQSKSKSSPHWASYWTGSFVVSPRAQKGTSTKRTLRGDPSKWWDNYQDTGTRANWLKAYAAERLDLFEVVQVNTERCTRCGGTGKVTKWSPQALANGNHEWQETCPRCFGAREDRGIGYR